MRLTKKEKAEAVLDARTLPFRDQVAKSASAFSAGYIGGWDKEFKSWIYELTGSMSGVRIVIEEDAAAVWIACNKLKLQRSAKTVRGMQVILRNLAVSLGGS